MEKDEHGNVILSREDVQNLKKILMGFGILYVTGNLIHTLLTPRSFYGWVKVTNEH